MNASQVEDQPCGEFPQTLTLPELQRYFDPQWEGAVSSRDQMSEAGGLQIGLIAMNGAKLSLVHEGGRGRHRYMFFARRLDNSDALNSEAWEIVRERVPLGKETWRALFLAERAVELNPNHAIVNTLGVAQYHCGLYQAARETLLRSQELAVAEEEAGPPTDLIFLAMVERALGNTDEAERVLARVESVISAERWDRDEECLGFLLEARKVIRDD